MYNGTEETFPVKKERIGEQQKYTGENEDWNPVY